MEVIGCKFLKSCGVFVNVTGKISIQRIEKEWESANNNVYNGYSYIGLRELCFYSDY